MKTFIILGGLFLFFVVLLVMALSSDETVTRKVPTPHQANPLENVTYEDTEDPFTWLETP